MTAISSTRSFTVGHTRFAAFSFFPSAFTPRTTPKAVEPGHRGLDAGAHLQIEETGQRLNVHASQGCTRGLHAGLLRLVDPSGATRAPPAHEAIWHIRIQSPLGSTVGTLRARLTTSVELTSPCMSAREERYQPVTLRLTCTTDLRKWRVDPLRATQICRNSNPRLPPTPRTSSTHPRTKVRWGLSPSCTHPTPYVPS